MNHQTCIQVYRTPWVKDKSSYLPGHLNFLKHKTIEDSAPAL